MSNVKPPFRIAYGRDESQFIELWRPPSKISGAAIFIHGGFWRAAYDFSHANPFCATLAARGFVTANLEYRRVTQSGGGWPGTFEDVLEGVDLARGHFGFAPVVIGHSAGGHLALRLAVEPVPLGAVVALAPVADLRLAYQLNLSNGAVAEFLGGSPETVPDRYDEACPSIKSAAVRRVVVHGSDDDTVPISISRAFLEAAKNDPEPPPLVEIPGAGHMDLIDPESPACAKVLEIVLDLSGRE